MQPAYLDDAVSAFKMLWFFCYWLVSTSCLSPGRCSSTLAHPCSSPHLATKGEASTLCSSTVSGVFSTQSCPTLCDPGDCSPPDSSVHGILQARILECAAISFSMPGVCLILFISNSIICLTTPRAWLVTSYLVILVILALSFCTSKDSLIYRAYVRVCVCVCSKYVCACVCVYFEKEVNTTKFYFLENKKLCNGSCYLRTSIRCRYDSDLSGILFFIPINLKTASFFHCLMEPLTFLKHIILLTPQKRESQFPRLTRVENSWIGGTAF